ncbi:acyltransferase family protein [Lacticaseibacillus jixianensis]|uniref:Acyltransferase family protein n=1 Tax=Lacticaseibacillus jixianensis TaxID=2486012 RepID=A0ABW4B808_9LACO|nr:acyltransferase family protein [Lacticaseibacillus jixianensis]
MANTTPAHQHIKWFSLVRILGLLMILGYHFFKVGYPGGFVGVDLFFVFSGFLITSLMIDEFARTQRFDLRAFLRRRFYRIVPAVVLMILITVPFTLLVSPDLITGLGKQVAAALGFVTNWFELATGGSYETNFIPHLFVHTWFLGVEMQFYLVWGLVVFLVARLLNKPEVPMRKRRVWFRESLFGLALVFGVSSLALMWGQAQGLKDFSPVYFSSLTHGFPLFLGAMLATVSGIGIVPEWFRRLTAQRPAWQPALVLAGAATLTVLLGWTVHFDAAWTYPFGLLITSLLAGIMILAARALHEATTTVAEPRITLQLASLSYGIYLYHWPLYVIFSRLLPQSITVALTLVLSVLFAAFSVAVVEPFVAGKPLLVGHSLRAKQLGAGGLLAGGAVLLALTVHQVSAAPALSQLETTLWTAGVKQDAARYVQAAPEIIAAHTPKQTAAANRLAQGQKAAAQAAKTDPHGYQAANRNSTASDHNIPAGVSIFGDSVTLGVSDYLGSHVQNAVVDAEGDRTMNQALTLVKNQQAAGTLREFVVIACGTNSLNDYAAVLKQVIATIKPGHKLIMVTPHNGQAKPDWNSSRLTALEQALPQQYDWITVADWAGVANAHPELFKGTDGVHFAGRQEGNVLFTQTINNALLAAAKQPAKP